MQPRVLSSPAMASREKEPWFKNGLRFECTRCGQCCGGTPGYVWVTEEEIAALARRFDLAAGDFRRRYTRRIGRRGVSLTETEDYDCIFLGGDGGCSVYEDRPRQCRTYPFWGRALASPATWDTEARECPGIHQGQSWSLVKIRVFADRDGLPEDR